MLGSYNHEEKSFHKAIGFTQEEFESFQKKFQNFIEEDFKRGEKIEKGIVPNLLESQVVEEMDKTFTEKEFLFMGFMFYKDKFEKKLMFDRAKELKGSIIDLILGKKKKSSEDEDETPDFKTGFEDK